MTQNPDNNMDVLDLEEYRGRDLTADEVEMLFEIVEMIGLEVRKQLGDSA